AGRLTWPRSNTAKASPTSRQCSIPNANSPSSRTNLPRRMPRLPRSLWRCTRRSQVADAVGDASLISPETQQDREARRLAGREQRRHLFKLDGRGAVLPGADLGVEPIIGSTNFRSEDRTP